MSEYTGTYTINNNQLICDVTTIIHTDVSPNDQTSVKLSFKIIDSNKLQLEDISKKELYNSKSIGKIFEL